MSAEILPVFWDLASFKDAERLAAAEKLVSSLSETQEKSGEGLSKDLEYSVKRLMKGLASPRQAARQGFTEALYLLLHRFPQVSLETVIDLTKEHLQASSNMKGHEESNVLFGQVMTVVALMRSGRLTSKKVKVESLQFVLEQLLSCRGRKSYLREVSSTVLGDLVAMAPSSMFKKHILPAIKEDLECGWEKCTAHQLLVLFKVYQHHSAVLGSSFFETHWGHADFLGAQNFRRFAEVLVKAGNIHSPKIHSAWIVLATLLVADSKKFALFWKTAVDTALLTSTLERRFSAFQLVEAMLPRVSVGQLPVVLSAPVLKYVVKSLSSTKSLLHAAAKHLCQRLVEIFKQIAETSAGANVEGATAEKELEGLVDMLLDLLWHPSRLLRSAVEEVFRGIVKHLTPKALDMIIAAVAGDDKDPEESEEADDSDMDASDSDEGDDESGEDEEESDDDEEDVSMDESDDDDGNVAGDGNGLAEDLEGSDSDLPDEEMPEDPAEIARVDAQLAQAFRLRMEMKKKQKVERLNITHFRLRALDIIEIFIRRCQGSPLLLRLVHPLIDVMLDKASDGQSAALVEKAQGLLKSRLCKSRIRPVSDPTEVEETFSLLQRLVGMAAHAPTSAITTAYTTAIMFVLRSVHTPASAPSQAAEAREASPPMPADVSKIVDVFAAPLEDFIKRKASRLSSSLFLELVSRHPAIAWRLARVMATHLPDSANEFRRKEICSMLGALMSRKDASTYAPLHLPGVSKQLRHGLCACLKQAIESSDNVKAKNFRQLVLVVQHFIRLSSLCDSKLLRKNSSEVDSAIMAVSDCDLAKRSPELKAILARVHGACAYLPTPGIAFA